MTLIEQAAHAVHIELGSAPLVSRPDPGVRAIEALQEVLQELQAYDDKLNDSANDGLNAQPPNGDDYNDIVGTVRHLATNALALVAQHQAEEVERACQTCRNYRLPGGEEPCGSCLPNAAALPNWKRA